MKIFVDENIPRITIDELTKRGYNVFDIRGTPKEGTDDDVIWEIARKEGRLIITTDKGFSKNISLPHFGIIIVKLKKPNHLRIHEATLRGLDKFINDKNQSEIIIVKDNVLVTRTIRK